MKYSIRKILVPVDLGEISLNALDTAVAMAERNGAELQILNVIEPSYDLSYESFASLSSLTNSSDVLQALAGAIQHKNDIAPKIFQEEGNVADIIIKQHLSHQADLIVMGTHGASGYRDGFIGSNSYLVMKNARCPVLTVPPRKRFTSFKKVLFPVRPSLGALDRYDVLCHLINKAASIDVLGLSYRFAERETNVLDKLVDEVKEKLTADAIKAKTSWGAGISVSEDVIQYAQQSMPDLLVVTSGLDAIAKSQFIGPHAQKIINSSKVPVLSVKKIGVPFFA